MKATTKLNKSFMSETAKKRKKKKKNKTITNVEVLEIAAKVAKESGFSKTSMPTIKDLKIAQAFTANLRSKRSILKEAGYSKSMQEKPIYVTDSQKHKNALKTIQQVAEDMGINDDFILGVVKQDIDDKGKLPVGGKNGRNRMREVEVMAKLVGAGTYGDKEDNKTGALTLIEVNIDNITAKEAKSLLEGSL